MQASDIVQIKARRELQPLIDVVLARCSYVFNRLCEIGISVMKDGDTGVLNVYEPFIKELRAVYAKFVADVEALCRAKLTDDFDTFTKVLDWDLLAGLADVGKEYDYLARDPAVTHARVVQLMEQSEAAPATTGALRGPRVGNGCARRWSIG